MGNVPAVSHCSVSYLSLRQFNTNQTQNGFNV